jgi:23S rRNA (adenine2503-C2)-methyltransferase
MSLSFHDLSEEDFCSFLEEKGEKAYRVDQILQWVYSRGVCKWESMLNLPLSLREQLSAQFSLRALQEIRQEVSANQETIKFLWKLSDGQLVESVLIIAPQRRTVCVSSQVGCPARCSFCASGKKGLLRNLTAGEIVEQVYHTQTFLKQKGERVSHIVFMGMGEPFANMDAVLKAIRFLSDPKRLGISQRKMTVSTVGIVEGIERFTEENLQVSLALSLHAPNQTLRQRLIPYARKYSLDAILAAMLAFAEKSGRDITYEYTLLAGINDQPEHARELANLLRGHPCTVNLIPYNPIDGIHFKRPSKDAVDTFRSILQAHNIPSTQRYTKGKDIQAACGQLSLQQFPN